MTDLVETHRDVIINLGLEPKFFKLIEATGLQNIQGYIGHLIQDSAKDRGVYEANFSAGLLRSVCNAFQYFQEDSLSDWGMSLLARLCSERYEGEQSDFAEIEAYGDLTTAFYDSEVIQVNEKSGKNGKTPDFQVGNELFVEVYCPDESHKEIQRVQEELHKQSGMVKTVISRPVTGSETLAVKYATNQTIARVLGAKRDNDQFSSEKKNILWVDLKHKLKLGVKQTLPLESINHANQTYIGCFGVWHSFYGEVEQSIFPTERYTLKFHGSLGVHTYKQHKHNGLFRERSHMSGAMLSCIDGTVLFLNPWCDNPLSNEQIHRLTQVRQFRPEYSFFVKSTLEADIASKEALISFLLDKQREGIE